MQSERPNAGSYKKAELSNAEEETEEETAPPTETKSIKENLAALWVQLLEKKFILLYSYMIQNGLFAGYISGCIYLLVVEVEKAAGKDVKNDDKVKNLINREISLVMVAYGIAGVIMSNFMSLIDKKYTKLVMKLNTLVVTALMIFILMFQEYITNIWVVVGIAFLSGVVDVGFNLMITVYLSTTFKGKLEGFTLWKQFCNICTAAFIVSYISIGETSYYGYIFSGINIVLSFVFVGTF